MDAQEPEEASLWLDLGWLSQDALVWKEFCVLGVRVRVLGAV